MALDVETEIAATLTDPNALMVYYQSGIDASQFADPKMAEMYSFASDYFLNFAAMRGAPTLDVLRERFPDYDALTQGRQVPRRRTCRRSSKTSTASSSLPTRCAWALRTWGLTRSRR